MEISFAERFEEALRMRDIKPAELSRKTKIPEGTISQYRKGAYMPKQKNLDKISKALNVTIDWLMGYDVPSNNESANKRLEIKTTDVLTAEEKQHIKKYRLLDQHGQKAVDSVLDVEYERCSNANDKNNLVEIPYVARSETGERGTIVKTQEEIDEFLKNLNPDTSGQY